LPKTAHPCRLAGDHENGIGFAARVRSGTFRPGLGPAPGARFDLDDRRSRLIMGTVPDLEATPGEVAVSRRPRPVSSIACLRQVRSRPRPFTPEGESRFRSTTPCVVCETRDMCAWRPPYRPPLMASSRTGREPLAPSARRWMEEPPATSLLPLDPRLAVLLLCGSERQ
jgi:hypothetical protein